MLKTYRHLKVDLLIEICYPFAFQHKKKDSENFILIFIRSKYGCYMTVHICEVKVKPLKGLDGGWSLPLVMKMIIIIYYFPKTHQLSRDDNGV